MNNLKKYIFIKKKNNINSNFYFKNNYKYL